MTRLRSLDAPDAVSNPIVAVPTPVGVNRGRPGHYGHLPRCPHACGGEPPPASPMVRKAVLSPRIWECTTDKTVPDEIQAEVSTPAEDNLYPIVRSVSGYGAPISRRKWV